jgi:RND family efflux transporter MFP subunit
MTTHSVKHKRRVSGCFILILLIIFGIFFSRALVKRLQDRRAPDVLLEEPPPPPTCPVVLTNLVRYRPYVATLEANHTILIRSSVAENIKNLYVDIGSVVTQGQVLLTFDTRYKKIAQKEAEAKYYESVVTYSNAFLDLNNNRTLYKSGVIGDDIKRTYLVAYHNAFAAKEKAEAQVDYAREQLEDCIVRAPCTAKVSVRFVDLGGRVMINQQLFTLVDDAILKLPFYVEDRDVILMRPGITGPFTIDSLADTSFTATVRAVGADVDSNSRLYRVEAVYDNSQELLKPGLLARTHVPVKNYKDAIFIPAYTVKLFSDGPYVSLYTPASNYFVAVTLGDEFNDMVQVTSGIKPGDRLLLQ